MKIENSGSVKIGSQEWTTENLNVSAFRNGDPIPEAQTNEEWKKASDEGKPAWCYYENDLANGKKYGKLYNWYAVNDTRGLAPEDWHIPYLNEWAILVNYLGDKEAGHKMKNTIGWDEIYNGNNLLNKYSPFYRTIGWDEIYNGNNYHYNGDNSSGLSAFPAGSRSSDGEFEGAGYNGFFWSSADDPEGAYYCGLYYNSPDIDHSIWDKGDGHSVRCVRDI